MSTDVHGVSPRSASCGNTLRYTKPGLAVQARCVAARRNAARLRGAKGTRKDQDDYFFDVILVDFWRLGSGGHSDAAGSSCLLVAYFLHIFCICGISKPESIETQPANQLSKHLEALDATKSYSSLYRF